MRGENGLYMLKEYAFSQLFHFVPVVGAGIICFCVHIIEDQLSEMCK